MPRARRVFVAPAAILSPMPRPAVFLDRDDTVNRNADLPESAWRGTPGDLLEPAHAHLLPGVPEALARLRGAGYALVVITNQGGVARGHGGLDDVEAVNDRIRALLAPPDPVPFGPALIDAFYACPFHPGGSVGRFADEHDWRKPRPGMFHAAAGELGLDLARSWMVGDKERDLAAAQAAGVPREHCLMVGPHAELAGLPEATARILAPPRDAVRLVPASKVTLHADLSEDPRPLADERVRETVIAVARSIAERTGVEVLDVSATDTALTAVISAPRVAAMGFAAELRRATNDWHAKRRSRPLWLDREG